jgi:isoleucyl-tRNA synthetase
MDPAYEAEILRAFAVFVERGLVYKSLKPVFWSTGAQTALAEAEVEYQDRVDTAIYVKFPIVTGQLKDQASLVIWTTTPWTLPANLAIAVHPKERYVVQRFTRGDESETLVLAEKLVPQFCATTGFALAGTLTPATPPVLYPGPGQPPWLQCSPAASWKASGPSIPFCPGQRSSSRPTSLPWTRVPGPSTSRPATAKTITR